MDRLLRIDGRTVEQVTRVISWLSTGRDPVAGFWRANVRSPKKLREKWDQMAEQYRERVGRQTGRALEPGRPSKPYDEMTDDEFREAYRSLPEADRVAAEQQRSAGLAWRAEQQRSQAG